MDASESFQESHSYARPSPKSLKTLPEIFNSISLLEVEEKEVSSSLEKLVASEEPILDAIKRLGRMQEPYTALQRDASSLSERVSATAQTADRVGQKVKNLDEEMRRIREAIDRVNQVMEFKESLLSLHSSMGEQDWESATRHCARAMAIPLEVISGPFAESTVSTSSLPLPPVQTLQEARQELLNLFLKYFRQASKAKDAAATSRFFKLFPLIGWEDEGLDAYASFVSELIHTKPPSSTKPTSPLYYTTVLTALFESICNIINQHRMIVEKYYGRGKMLYVIERLMKTCDDAVRKLIEEWEDNRSMILQSPIRKSLQSSSAPQDDLIDAREVDKVLTELSAMIMRYTAFRRYVYNNFQDVSASNDEDAQLSPESSHARAETQADLELIEKSGCHEIFLRLTNIYYIPLEIWYLKNTVTQAFRSSTTEQSQIPPSTTVPDLVFYLLKTVIYRMLFTGFLNAIEGLIPKVREIMDQDFVAAVKRKLDDVYRHPVNTGSGLKGEKLERENRFNFIVLLNDIDISSAHMERLVQELLMSNHLSQNFREQELRKVQTLVSSLLSLTPKFSSTLRNGIEQLFAQLIRPRLRTFVTEVYKDVSYLLNDDAYTASQYQDVVRKRFEQNWEAVTESYKEIFTESNFRILFALAVDVITRALEKHVFTLKFTDLGAIRFDRDLRAILSYLSSQTGFVPTREKFQRLQQMSTLLNLDKEEDAEEFYSGSGISWKLSFTEARSVTALKQETS